MSLLGSLLCLPNYFEDIPVLQPVEMDLVILTCSEVKVASFLCDWHFTLSVVPSYIL